MNFFVYNLGARWLIQTVMTQARDVGDNLVHLSFISSYKYIVPLIKTAGVTEVQWIRHKFTNPGVTCSTPHFSSVSNETLNPDSISV